MGAPKTSHSKQILSLLISRIKLTLGNLSPFSFFLPQMVSVTGRKLGKLPGHHQPHEISVKFLLGAWNPPGYPGPKEWVLVLRVLQTSLVTANLSLSSGQFYHSGHVGGKVEMGEPRHSLLTYFFLSSSLLQKGNLFSSSLRCKVTMD